MTIFFAFSYDFYCFFINKLIFFFLKLIIFIDCSLNNLQNLFIQSLPLYTSCLFFMLLYEDIVDIEKPDGICSLAYYYGRIFRIVFTSITLFYQTFKICINNKCCFIRFLILVKCKYFSDFTRHSCTMKIFTFTYSFMQFKFAFCSRRMEAIQTIKISLMFYVIILNNADNLFTAR